MDFTKLHTFSPKKKNANISPNLKKKYGYRIKLFFLLEYRKHWIENRILNKKNYRDHASLNTNNENI